MATTIKLKNGSGAPLAGDLVQGEPALDLTNKRLYTEDSGGTVIEVGTNPSTLTVDTNTLVVDATNNRVGIGTGSPSVTLEVNGEAKFGSGNAFVTSTNVFKSAAGAGVDGAYLRAAISGASTPTYANSDDTDTGMFFPASNTLGLSTGGTERMRIDSSGNVGIGITNPAADLVVAGSSSGEYDALILRNSSGVDTSSTSITFEVSGGTHGTEGATAAKISALREGGGTTGALLFHTTSSGTSAERVRIDSSGNVGIGTTSPSSLLDVSSGTNTDGTDVTITIGGTSANTRQSLITKKIQTSDRALEFYAASGGSSEDIRFFRNNTNETMRIDTIGRVGIGTTSPARVLHVESNGLADLLLRDTSSYSVGTGPAVIFQGNDSGGTTTQFGAIYGVSNGSNSGDLTFETRNSGSSAERMRIDSSGNVGIGTTSPTFGSGSGLEVERSGSATVRVERTGATAASGEFFAGNGKVVIGSTSNTHLEFRTNSTENMRIDSSGNVGIGTTSPSAVISSSKIVQVGSGGNTTLSVTSTDSVNDRSAILELLSSGNGTSQSIILYGDTDTSPSTPSPLVFQGYHSGARTERMRLDASGNLLVGKTTTALTTAGVALLPNGELYVTRDSGATAYFNREGSDGDVIVIRNDNVTVGSISVSGSTTSYNPSSDVRLKENIRDYDNALADVMKLKPRKYSWKTDGAEDSGFIAQELMETPEFANRVNPIDDDSDDPMYGVDYMKFVAVLTGAIQEQQAMIETLQAEVAALKGA